jgi:hypothetical protein
MTKTETEMTMTNQQQMYAMLVDDPTSAVAAVLAAIGDGVLDEDLKTLGEELVDRSKKLTLRRDREKVPTHKIVGDVRPRYLAGAKGRAGGWVSDTRREFFPAPGSEAYARGRRWKITAENIAELGQAA